MKNFYLLIVSVRKNRVLRNYKTSTGWGWDFDLSELNDFVDSEGALYLELIADFYVEFEDTTAEILEVTQESPESEVESLNMRKGAILRQIASLLGDDITSDVIVSVRTTEDVEIGTFFCHSAILSGKRNVQNIN